MRKRIPGLKRKGVATLVAAALVAMFAFSGTAYANINSSSGDTSGKAPDGYSWTVPKAPMSGTVVKGGKTYKVLSSWLDGWAGAGMDYLGISNAAWLGINGGQTTTPESLEAAKTKTLVGIWASEANESPNAFNWNAFYNLYANANGLSATDWTVIDSAKWDSSLGVYSVFKYRPELVWENNDLKAAAATKAISSINQGLYYKDTDSTYTYTYAADGDGWKAGDEYYTGSTDLSTTTTPPVYEVKVQRDTKYYADADSKIELTRKQDDTQNFYAKGDSAASKFAAYGDENYNPTFHAAFNNSSVLGFSASFYDAAEEATQAIKNTANYPGLSSGEQLNYLTVNKLPRSNRYDEDPYACAANYEKSMKASVYYVLSQIASGNATKKKVAFVTEAPSTGTTVKVVAYDFTENVGSGPTGGYVGDSCLTVDQLMTNSVDSTGNAGAGGGTSVKDAVLPYTIYNATADDLATCDIVYAPTLGDSTTWKTWVDGNVTPGTDTSKIKYFTNAAAIMQWSNYTVEKSIQSLYAINCFYPELFPNMELVAYFYDKVYHLNASAVPTALQWGLGNSTLPDNTQLSQVGSTYSLDDMNSKFATGLAYYQASSATDPVISRVIGNQFLNANHYDGTLNNAVFAPTSYLTDSLKNMTRSISTAKDKYSVKATAAAFDLKASVVGGGTLSYASSKPSVATVKDGVVTPKGYGTTTITITAPRTDFFAESTKAITVTVTRASQTVSATKSLSKTYSASKTTKKLASKKTVNVASLSKAKAKTALTYSKSNKAGASKITVSKAGKVTLKKGLAKGKYKVNILAAAKQTAVYSKASKTITLTVTVK